MKRYKKVIAGVLTAAMVFTSAIGVFAEGSRSKFVGLVGDSIAYYQVDQAIEETEDYKNIKKSDPETIDIIDKTNASEEMMATYEQLLTDYIAKLPDGPAKESAKKVLEQIKNKDFVTPFFDLIPVGDVKKNANNKYEPTLSVPVLTENTTDNLIIHYSDVRNLWEILTPKSVDLKAKTITVEFEDLSPVAIIAKVGTFNKNTDTQPQGTSPKTAEGSNGWVMWIGAAFVLIAAGSSLIYKKREVR